MSYPDDVRMIRTNTNEVFFLVEPGYWTNKPRHWSLYLKERPELQPLKESSTIDGLAYRRDYINYKIGFGLEKAYYFNRDNCYDIFEEFNLYHPHNAKKFFNVFKTNNGDYYILDNQLVNYSNKKGFEFISRLWVMHDMLYFLKISEGVYREIKKEYFIFSDNENIYIVNCDYLSSWNRFKSQLFPNKEFKCLDLIFTKDKSTLLPIYTENEIIRINYGIYRTRNIVPEKEYKKYIPGPPINIKPEIISNRELYYIDNPEFWCFQNINGDEYIVNKNFLEDALIGSPFKFNSSSFLYKKYLYSVQPIEYSFFEKGIFIKNKPVYIDSVSGKEEV